MYYGIATKDGDFGYATLQFVSKDKKRIEELAADYYACTGDNVQVFFLRGLEEIKLYTGLNKRDILGGAFEG